MNFNNVLSSLGGALKMIAPAIVPGASAAISAGMALAEAFTKVKAANGGEAPADAEAAHDAVVARVNEHANATFDRAEKGD